METIGQALERAIQLHRAGDLAQAEPLYRQILATIPAHVDALHLLGLLAHQTGRNTQAVELLRQAVEINGKVPQFQHHLGLALQGCGRLDEAAQCLRQALELDAAQPDWNAALGRVLMALKDYRGAAEAFHRELTNNPADLGALTNLGVCCYELEDLAAAKNAFQRMLQLKPDDAIGWHNLAGILLEEGLVDEAAVSFDRAITIQPDYLQAYNNRVCCEQYRPTVSPESLARLTGNWQSVCQVAVPVGKVERSRIGQRKLRIGFVSPDFCRAPAGYFLAGLVEALDPARAEVHVYSDSPIYDDLSVKLQSHATAWHKTRDLPDQALWELIHAADVDILFDLAGHTKGNRLTVFARRPGGVQISWAGFAGTTGMDSMDALLADRFHIPEGQEHHYRERVVKLPNDYICYYPPHYAPTVGRLPAADLGHITFAAFHNSAKCGTASIDLWSRVMAEVPQSQIILKHCKLSVPAIKQRVLGEFGRRGIAAERIVIEGTSPHGSMLQRYNQVDIGLDSRPYSGGLTTCEALLMGVPVVTLPGRTFAGRHSLSHLANVGLNELVAADEAEYIKIAVALAKDLPRLAEMRASLRPRLLASPLGNYPKFAEDFLQAMHELLAA